MKWLWIPLLAMGLWVGTANGQGCSQCRDAVGQTSEQTKLAYRRGIEVLVVAVGCVAAATILVVKRFR